VSLLRDEPNLLEAACARVSAQTSIPVEHIEKDYWLTESLRALADYSVANSIPVVLKGGTSLSKCFGLLQRFSEDADMIVVFGELPETQKRRHLKGLVAAVETATGLSAVTDTSATFKGQCRVVTLAYPDADATTVPPRVKVELHTIGGAVPKDSMELRSLLSEHWHQVAPQGVAGDYSELAPFSIEVLEPSRTLVEKLVILHEAHTRDRGQALARKSVTVRHYYDVWCLLGDKAVCEALQKHNVAILAREVYNSSVAANYKTAARPAGGFAASPAFASGAASVEADYDKVVRELVWPGANAPTFVQCLDRVRQKASLL
jgi:hypothetical protein